MEMVYWILDPIIDFLAALRITPNMVTLFSLLPAAGAGVALGFGWFGLASVLAVIATFCDILDGLLARKTGRVVERRRGGRRRGRSLRRDVLVRGPRLLLPRRTTRCCSSCWRRSSARSWSATRRRRPRRWAWPRRAARCAGASARRTSSSAPPSRRWRRRCSPTRPRWRSHECPIILALSIVAVVSNISVVQRLAVRDGGAAREREGGDSGRVRRRGADRQQAGRVRRARSSRLACLRRSRRRKHRRARARLRGSGSGSATTPPR